MIIKLSLGEKNTKSHLMKLLSKRICVFCEKYYANMICYCGRCLPLIGCRILNDYYLTTEEGIFTGGERCLCCGPCLRKFCSEHGTEIYKNFILIELTKKFGDEIFK